MALGSRGGADGSRVQAAPLARADFDALERQIREPRIPAPRRAQRSPTQRVVRQVEVRLGSARRLSISDHGGRMWVRDPHRGGKKIPADVQRRTAQRIQGYAGQHHRHRFERLEVRFRGVFCYVDAYVEPDSPSDDLLNVLGETRDEYVSRLRNTPLRLCRLRFFGDEEAWSMAYYTYSHEKYEGSFFATGGWFGTPEEAFETCAMFLQR